MPRHKIVSVRDRQADAYNRPIFVPTTGLAIRSFSDEINRVSPDNPMNTHPEDYELFLLGEFDDESAIFENLAHPQLLARAVDVLIKSN